jgi:hypothetical protein
MHGLTMTNLNRFVMSFRILCFVLDLELRLSVTLNHLKKIEDNKDHGRFQRRD